jgi:uroporphyrinogen-III synthase
VTRRVLVTRPEPGASVTAARLRGLGFAPVMLPLTRIEAVVPPALPDPAGYDAVAVTSSNAIRHAPPGLIDALANRPVFAVGERTAERTKDAGLRELRAAADDGERLAAAIRSALPAGAHILYLTGAIRGEEFEAVLAASGFPVTPLVVYDAPDIVYSSAGLVSRIGQESLEAALVYSTRAGELLAGIAARQELSGCFRDTAYLCISQKAAAPLERIAGGRIAVSGTPDEAGVMALLRQMR